MLNKVCVVDIGLFFGTYEFSGHIISRKLVPKSSNWQRQLSFDIKSLKLHWSYSEVKNYFLNVHFISTHKIWVLRLTSIWGMMTDFIKFNFCIRLLISLLSFIICLYFYKTTAGRILNKLIKNITIKVHSILSFSKWNCTLLTPWCINYVQFFYFIL